MPWKLGKDGWHRDETGGDGRVIGGKRVDYYDRPIPPVRDTMNRPLKDGQIDTRRWIEEVNEGKWPRR